MSNVPETTYPLRAAAQMTGLSPELLRAWERRYGVVDPLRTEGGTRRYRASDLERLRQLKHAVDSGRRISEVAKLSPEELEQIASEPTPPGDGDFSEIFSALKRLDADELRRLLGIQYTSLGPFAFAREFALPLAREIGDHWADERLSVAAEHLASVELRSLLGAALRPSTFSRNGPKIVFATLGGERHELGLLVAALTAMGAGGNPVYLGVEVPVDDLLRAVDAVGAQALALGMVGPADESDQRSIAALRGGMSESQRIWVGGVGSAHLTPIEGVEFIDSMDSLEQRVSLLAFERQ